MACKKGKLCCPAANPFRDADSTANFFNPSVLNTLNNNLVILAPKGQLNWKIEALFFWAGAKVGINDVENTQVLSDPRSL